LIVADLVIEVAGSRLPETVVICDLSYGYEEADARLIASAPALLAALELAERQLRSWHIGTKPASRVDVRVQEALDIARAALRAATGEGT
jgi:hypothetical protein